MRDSLPGYTEFACHSGADCCSHPLLPACLTCLPGCMRQIERLKLRAVGELAPRQVKRMKGRRATGTWIRRGIRPPLLLWLIGSIACCSANGDKIDCLIDEKKGSSNPANVYQCPSRQSCCLEYARPSCCGSKPASLIM